MMKAVRRLIKAAQMRKKLNNKGLSLVEIIVAVVIFAAAVAPTMRLFSSAVGNNARSREQQRALAVAESTIESFKAYSIKDLCLQFGTTPGSAAQGTALAANSDAFKGVSYDGSTTLSVEALQGSTNVVAVDTEKQLNYDATHYNFKIKNAIEEEKRYDVEIEVNKQGDFQILEMKEMNPYTDAVIKRKSNDLTDLETKLYGKAQDDLAALANPADMVSGGTKILDTVNISSVDRKINITTATSGAAEIVKLTIDYDFALTYSYKYVSTGSGIKTKTGQSVSGTIQHDFGAGTSVFEEIVYDNSASIASAGGDLEGIYLYYEPMYAGVIGATSATDTINIDTSGVGTPVEVRVIKQKASGVSDTALQVYEDSYSLAVNGASNATLFHNLSKRIVGTGNLTPSLGGFSVTKSLEEDTKNDQGLLYDITVKVYKAGETDVIAAFRGTMNN